MFSTQKCNILKPCIVIASTTLTPEPANEPKTTTPTSIMFFQQDDGSNEINTTDETNSYYDADLDYTEEETIEQSGVTTTEYTIEPTENADSKDTLGIGSLA